MVEGNRVRVKWCLVISTWCRPKRHTIKPIPGFRPITWEPTRGGGLRDFEAPAWVTLGDLGCNWVKPGGRGTPPERYRPGASLTE